MKPKIAYSLDKQKFRLNIPGEESIIITDELAREYWDKTKSADWTQLAYKKMSKMVMYGNLSEQIKERDDERDEAIGKEIAEKLNLKQKSSGLYLMSDGTHKSHIGLARMIKRIIENAPKGQERE